MAEHPYIFLSHAHADKPVADALVSLLSEGANVTSDRILCTSLEGLGLETGTESIAAAVRDDLTEASLVIVLASEMYLTRAYCLCELGGAWASRRRLFPATLGNAVPDALSGILTDTLARPLREPSTLDELRDRVNEALHDVAGTSPTPTAWWNSKRDRFLGVLPHLEEQLDLPDLVKRDELHEAQREAQALVRLLEEREVEIRRLSKLNEALKDATTKQEADRLELESLGELDRFRTAVALAHEKAKGIPNVVLDVAYHETAGDAYEVDHDYPDTVTELREAAQRKMVEFDGRSATLDSSTGRVRRFEEALSTLRNVIDSSGGGFYDWYETEHDRPPALDDREFWETHLGLR